MKHTRSYVPPWIAPAFTNSWVNFGGGTYPDIGYMRTPDNIIHLKGMMKSGVIGSAAFILPVGYRPEMQEIFVVDSNGAFGAVEITSGGSVVPTVGNNAYVSLSGISFRAAP